MSSLLTQAMAPVTATLLMQMTSEVCVCLSVCVCVCVSVYVCIHVCVCLWYVGRVLVLFSFYMYSLAYIEMCAWGMFYISACNECCS